MNQNPSYAILTLGLSGRLKDKFAWSRVQL